MFSRVVSTLVEQTGHAMEHQSWFIIQHLHSTASHGTREDIEYDIHTTLFLVFCPCTEEVVRRASFVR